MTDTERRSEVTNELLFETLKAVQPSLSDLREDVREIKGRMGILEAQYASLSNRIDRIDDRTTRIERRLDLEHA